MQALSYNVRRKKKYCKEGRKKEEEEEREGREGGREGREQRKKKNLDAYDIRYSRVVTLPSTDRTSTCLISVSETGTDAFRCVWP
jgi:hypothetical protein